jgi:hypothetical protein
VWLSCKENEDDDPVAADNAVTFNKMHAGMFSAWQ